MVVGRKNRVIHGDDDDVSNIIVWEVYTCYPKHIQLSLSDFFRKWKENEKVVVSFKEDLGW